VEKSDVTLGAYRHTSAQAHATSVYAHGHLYCARAIARASVRVRRSCACVSVCVCVKGAVICASTHGEPLRVPTWAVRVVSGADGDELKWIVWSLEDSVVAKTTLEKQEKDATEKERRRNPGKCPETTSEKQDPPLYLGEIKKGYV
jgi:hypothetical protein